MGRPIPPFRGLPDQAYDPRVTDLERPLRAPQGPSTAGMPADGNNSTPNGGYVNRNRANTVPFQLVGGAASIRALPANSKRSGLILQNKDSAATLNFAFGNVADANSLQLAAGASILLDFTCPQDEVWLFSSASNIICTIVEMSRGVG